MDWVIPSGRVSAARKATGKAGDKYILTGTMTVAWIVLADVKVGAVVMVDKEVDAGTMLGEQEHSSNVKIVMIGREYFIKWTDE
jgi:hypothetical protein